MAKAKKSNMASCAPEPNPEWQAEDDLRTLTRAEEVRSDPARLKRVRRVQEKQVRALRRVGSSLGRGRSRAGR